MRKIIILLVILLPFASKSQFHNVLSWKNESTISYGIKISTNITAGSEFFPIINIDGYNNTEAATIALKIAWDNKSGEFGNAAASSNGGYAPRIFLKNEDDKVVIFLKTKEIENIRLKISAVLQGVENESEWYDGWSISDVAGDGIEVIYSSEFIGDTKVRGLLTLEQASIPQATIGTAIITGLYVTGSGGVSGNFNAMGRVGIGTSNPASDAALDVNGKLYTRGTLVAKEPYCPSCNGVDPTTTDVDVMPAIDASGYVFLSGRMAINETRTSRIGTNAFAVNGTAIFTKAKVELNSTWPDYVFEPTYSLRSLQSLEEYLQQNKHLPDVPTANEVAKGGLDLGENQAILLKKIEELTLYVIDQNKRMDEQLKLIEEQRKMLLELKGQLKK